MSSDLVRQALDRWKAKLLDLSRRNRLLNFKPTKSSTLQIMASDLSELLRRLLTDNRPLRLAPRQHEEALPLVDDLDPLGLGTGATGRGRPAAASPDDTWTLGTDKAAEKFERTCRRINEQATLVLTEMGINVLFVALGFLRYFESHDSDQVHLAPLVLLPASLEKDRSGRYDVRATGEDPVFNPALRELLQHDYGVALPEWGPDDCDPAIISEAVRSATASYPRWEVTAESWLGFFAFQRFLMFKDLERNRDLFAGNEFLRRMLTGWDADVTSSDDLGIGGLDQRFPPEDTFQVVDADASQTKALETVARGRNLVIIGPPGTGKSQTITNLIANGLAQAKSILFVSEKMAALKVVFDRLRDVGLADFCLEVHSTSANKAAFYKEIGRSLDRALVAPAVPTLSVNRLREIRAELHGYSTALHTPQAPLGWSPYQAYGRLAEVQGAPPMHLNCDVLSIGPEELETTRRAIVELTAAWGTIGDPRAHPWRDCGKSYFSREDRRLTAWTSESWMMR